MDASGQAPGCYVLTTKGTKDKIESASTRVDIMKDIELKASGTTELVADFDLRTNYQTVFG